MNITLSIDEQIVKKVRKIAIDRDTTLNAMVREYLTSVAESDLAVRKEQAAQLMSSTERLARDMGPRSWTREDLHAERLSRYGR